MKRKRHHRSGSDGLVPEEHREAEDEGEDRLEQLLDAAVAVAMPEASDGEGQGDGDCDGDGEAPNESHHHEKPVIEAVVEKKVVVEADMAMEDAEAVEEEFQLPNMRRFHFFSASSIFFFSVRIRGIANRN